MEPKQFFSATVLTKFAFGTLPDKLLGVRPRSQVQSLTQRTQSGLAKNVDALVQTFPLVKPQKKQQTHVQNAVSLKPGVLFLAAFEARLAAALLRFACAGGGNTGILEEVQICMC
jgi:hypothetical protein